MTPNTKKQISDLNIDPNLPLMIFDADEVPFISLSLSLIT